MRKHLSIFLPRFKIVEMENNYDAVTLVGIFSPIQRTLFKMPD